MHFSSIVTIRIEKKIDENFDHALWIHIMHISNISSIKPEAYIKNQSQNFIHWSRK